MQFRSGDGSNQRSLLWHVIYVVIRATLDLPYVTLSAAGKFCCFTGYSFCTASREDYLGVLPGSRLQGCLTPCFRGKFMVFCEVWTGTFVISGQPRVESFPGVKQWVVCRNRPSEDIDLKEFLLQWSINCFFVCVFVSVEWLAEKILKERAVTLLAEDRFVWWHTRRLRCKHMCRCERCQAEFSPALSLWQKNTAFLI